MDVNERDDRTNTVMVIIGLPGLRASNNRIGALLIGVRMALEAARGDIIRMVLQQGLWVAAAAVAPGLALAYIVGQTMQALLAGIEPGDVPTFLSAAGLCLVMTLVGSFLPALCAVWIDPMQAIRAE